VVVEVEELVVERVMAPLGLVRLEVLLVIVLEGLAVPKAIQVSATRVVEEVVERLAQRQLVMVEQEVFPVEEVEEEGLSPTAERPVTEESVRVARSSLSV
jgi:hypothetical protein